MKTPLEVLKFVLDELGVDARVDSLDARKLLQKAVYLGQSAGVDLGYRYGWYIRGPYSSPLARDYYALASALASGEAADGELRADLRAKLAPIRGLLNVPAGMQMSKDDWGELLASLHFLRTVSALSRDAAIETMRKEKPHLVAQLEAGERALKNSHLLT